MPNPSARQHSFNAHAGRHGNHPAAAAAAAAATAAARRVSGGRLASLNELAAGSPTQQQQQQQGAAPRRRQQQGWRRGGASDEDSDYYAAADEEDSDDHELSDEYVHDDEDLGVAQRSGTQPAARKAAAASAAAAAFADEDQLPLKHQRWTDEEHAQLVALVQKYGRRNWKAVAENMKGRNSKQCRERYLTHEAKEKRGNWTLTEEFRMASLHCRLGNRWVAIALQMPGRSDNCLKNHWNAVGRSKRLSNIPSSTSSGTSNFLWWYIRGIKRDGKKSAEALAAAVAKVPASERHLLTEADEPQQQQQQQRPHPAAAAAAAGEKVNLSILLPGAAAAAAAAPANPEPAAAAAAAVDAGAGHPAAADEAAVQRASSGSSHSSVSRDNTAGLRGSVPRSAADTHRGGKAQQHSAAAAAASPSEGRAAGSAAQPAVGSKRPASVLHSSVAAAEAAAKRVLRDAPQWMGGEQ
ncbi:hypothetical protein OEZ86_010222 [Tetradesmus obliquus]|nr:hypothetical protein OEZ86_010222 [Tetradesmus obliquus]